MIKLILSLNGFESITSIAQDGFRTDEFNNIHVVLGNKRYKIETNGDPKDVVFLLQWADVYGNIIIDLRNYELTEVV